MGNSAVKERAEAATLVEALPTDKDHTLEEVAKHKTKEDCWIVVQGIIYNATTYLENHPGGPAWILEAKPS